MPTNSEFLTLLFGDDAPFTHVTDFQHDPDHIPPGQHLIAWKGGYFRDWKFLEQSNQYFTVSHFYCDDKGQARRRKSLFRHTRVIVLDDVREKLPIEQVNKLPHPTWILETSPGSEQWGYLLNEPCTVRHRVENLLDGLVANGLAPSGRDPGMKGVTRYVRLPDGYNTKASKAVNGQPWKCRLLVWEPFNTVTLEQLAQPFAVDLDALRREGRVDGASAIADHPLVNIPDLIHIKEERSDGRFDVTCPWVDEHTGHVDNGTAVFTNQDGTIGFKCHHGACEQRTGRHLLEVIEQDAPGFGEQLRTWQLQHALRSAGVSKDGGTQRLVAPAPQPGTVSDGTPAAPERSPAEPAINTEQACRAAIRELRDIPPTHPDARTHAAAILQVVDTLPAIERQHWHEEVRSHMQWSKTDFKTIITDLRETWYATNKITGLSFMDNTVFVGALNEFYDREKGIFYSPEAYQNYYAHLASEVRNDALKGGLVQKVDRLEYAPLMPMIFERNGIRFANTWNDSTEIQGHEGDVTPYLRHFDVMGWTKHREHILQYFAFTIRHQDQKINHMMILGSLEGAGKDWLLTPLIKALGNNSITINGEDLASTFNGYLLGHKHVHINEVELGDHREAMAITAKLKPLSTAPPHTLMVNQKGIKPIPISNLVSATMTTNSPVPIKLPQASRRVFALWSDFNPRDEEENMLPQWLEYWKGMWHWMNNGGAEAVVWYLRNKVDLSAFNPGAPPPVTEFLRDIRESSVSPVVAGLQALIKAKVGALAHDLTSVHDIINTIKGTVMTNPDLLQGADPSWYTVNRLGRVMREMGYSHVRTPSTRIYIIRNRDIYANMSISEIETQYLEVSKLKVVNMRAVK